MVKGGPKPFRFEAGWLEENKVLEIIRTMWANTIVVISDRTPKCNELGELHKVEEIYWRPRSRSKWLKEGDLNTKYFNAIASARRRHYELYGLSIPRVDFENDNALEEAVIGHFRKAFSSEVKVTPLLNRVPFKVLSVDGKLQLEREITMEELQKAVFALPRDKALDPNGFPLCFFHCFWNIEGDLLVFMKNFMATGKIFKRDELHFFGLDPKKGYNFRPLCY
ncbi:uncharacterized protein LOC105420389 [Amborella trichopoda]|uniref:uncharacterized protein LOC105420389 n=1 Tax=Amborella trichopoda TaxID=13333 RepID=UPI0005D2E7FF|nr:uncharacterized protein LOC105420389 [Amborella trichopoda]|eukprot:XP_011622117.1 uncharacterized protein LOC105420389 [Amborella trichopoda]